MLIQPDCIPCIMKMAVSSARKVDIKESLIKIFCREILTIPALKGSDWSVTGPGVIEQVMQIFYDIIGNYDPFFHIKEDMNQQVLKIYPLLKETIKNSDHSLYTASKLSILGNSVDFMMPGGTYGIKDFIMEKLKSEISINEFDAFKKRLEQSRMILIFGDNAGEIVFDRLLIETIKNRFDIEIFYVVKSQPTLNDSTMNEAKTSGIIHEAQVIENGIDGPLPGTVLSRCSIRVKDLFERADLIISKGGGNFDCLDEDRNQLKKDITFMLLSKCYPYTSHFNVPMHHPVLQNVFVTTEL